MFQTGVLTVGSLLGVDLHQKDGQTAGLMWAVFGLRQGQCKQELCAIGSCACDPLCVCAVVCRWDLALKLLQQMQAEGLRPSSACLTSAINACLQGELARLCLSTFWLVGVVLAYWSSRSRALLVSRNVAAFAGCLCWLFLAV